MKQHRIRKFLVVLATIINILLILVLVSSTVLLVVANGNASRTGTVQIMGYSLYLTDAGTENLSENTGIIVTDVDGYAFEEEETLICRMENSYGEFNIVSCRYIRSNENNKTVVIADPSTGRAVQIEREDVLGRCVFTSSFLGSWLAILQDSDSRSLFLAIVVGSGVLLLLLCLFLRMSYSRKNKPIPVNEWEEGALPEEIDVFGASKPEQPELPGDEAPAAPAPGDNAVVNSPVSPIPSKTDDLPNPLSQTATPPAATQSTLAAEPAIATQTSISPAEAQTTAPTTPTDDDSIDALLSELKMTSSAPSASSPGIGLDDGSVDQIVNWLNSNKPEEK